MAAGGPGSVAPMGERRRYPAGTFCWTDLGTSDPDGATAFYTALFGWESEVLPDQGSGAYTLLRRDGRLVSALYGPAGAQPSAWHSYVAVDDADAVAVRPVTEMGTSGRMVVLADPTGALFAAWQADEHAGAEVVNDPGALCLNQLNTDDPDAAGRFYTELFGWRIPFVGTDTDAYWGIYNDDALNGGMMPLAPGAPGPPHWLVYFTATTDLDPAARHIDQLGGRILVPPMAVPTGRILVAADPQGATFAIFDGPVDP